jgi:hypothetical protein
MCLFLNIRDIIKLEYRNIGSNGENVKPVDCYINELLLVLRWPLIRYYILSTETEEIEHISSYTYVM